MCNNIAHKSGQHKQDCYCTGILYVADVDIKHNGVGAKIFEESTLPQSPYTALLGRSNSINAYKAITAGSMKCNAAN